MKSSSNPFCYLKCYELSNTSSSLQEAKDKKVKNKIPNVET